MSAFHDFKIHYEPRYEEVDFIVPERIVEACIYRELTLKEGSEKCGIEYRKFLRYANGRQEIPKEMIFNLMKGLGFPAKFFYQIKWKRV